MAEYDKPVPTKNELNAPFFEGSLESKIRLQRGKASGKFWFPFSPFDPSDLSTDYEWADVSGRGTLWSWVVFHNVYFPSYKDDIPYPVIFVKLDEGPLMIATVPADVAIGDLKIDMPLQVEFEPATDEWAIAKFRPVA